MNAFGIWTLPATQRAVRLAAEARFKPAHYDAVERAVRRIGRKEINGEDVEDVIRAIIEYEAAICQQCGRFHDAPACQAPEAE